MLNNFGMLWRTYHCDYIKIPQNPPHFIKEKCWSEYQVTRKTRFLVNNDRFFQYLPNLFDPVQFEFFLSIYKNVNYFNAHYFILTNNLRFAVKVGVATAAVYYIKEQDVWKSSNESIKTIEKLKDGCKPYVQEIKTQIPIEV